MRTNWRTVLSNDKTGSGWWPQETRTPQDRKKRNPSSYFFKLISRFFLFHFLFWKDQNELGDKIIKAICSKNLYRLYCTLWFYDHMVAFWWLFGRISLRTKKGIFLGDFFKILKWGFFRDFGPKKSKIPNSVFEIFWDFSQGIFRDFKSPIPIPGISNPRGFFDLTQKKKSPSPKNPIPKRPRSYGVTFGSIKDMTAAKWKLSCRQKTDLNKFFFLCSLGLHEIFPPLFSYKQ